jgi:hypothetical protein
MRVFTTKRTTFSDLSSVEFGILLLSNRPVFLARDDTRLQRMGDGLPAIPNTPNASNKYR